MPSTPHFTVRAVVFVLSLIVTAVATKWAMAERGFPGDPLEWPLIFLRRMTEGLRRKDRETAYWTAIGVFSLAIAVMHFGGIQYNIYTDVSWWDLLTHALSGFGVAVLLYLTFHRPEPERRSTRWIVPAVLAFGAGFEVYEFVFKDFWYAWAFRYYLVDTVVDLVAGVLGGVLFVTVVVGYRSLRNRRQKSRSH